MWEPVSRLIPKSVHKAGIARAVSDALVCEEFDTIARHILGEAASKCRAIYVKDRCLWVAVLSNAVSNELKLYEQDILRVFRERFGAGRITELRFMV